MMITLIIVWMNVDVVHHKPSILVCNTLKCVEWKKRTTRIRRMFFDVSEVKQITSRTK